MIRIYLFTYAGDAEEALVCVRCAAAALPEAVITVVDDESAPIAERARIALVEAGARYRQTGWTRNGNLRGPECVRGIISTLAGEAEDEDVIVKIDSDTLLLSGGCILDMQRNGLALHASGYQVPGHPSERSAYGPCYAISGRAARLAAEELMQADIPALAPEDLTICRTIQGLFPPERIRLDEPWTPFNREGKWTAWNWFSIAVTPKKYAGFWMVTFGNPRPTNIPKSERARAMDALYRYKFHKEEDDHFVDVNNMIVLGKEG